MNWLLLDSLLILLAAVLQLASSLCECGYSATLPNVSEPVVFTEMMETDFTRVQDMAHSPDWVRQQFNVSAKAGRGVYGKMFMPDNVVSAPRDGDAPDASSDREVGLELRVGSKIGDDAVPAAEVDTKRVDLYWGSYRAGMKLTDVNGTCAAFFWYFNDTQEIDIEFLSREFDRDRDVYPINLVVQSKQSMEAGYDASATGTFSRVNLTFDPAAAFHEYRFDYLPNEVLFYADSKLLARMEGSNMPSTAGHLILQHWSNGNPKWSGGPPAQDAVLTVSYVKAYFNSSDSRRQGDGAGRCHDASGDGAVCAIPNVTAANASTGGDFFTVHVGGTDKEDSGQDGRRRCRRMLWVSLVTMAVVWLNMYPRKSLPFRALFEAGILEVQRAALLCMAQKSTDNVSELHRAKAGRTVI
ncbi:hypothetical protein G7046_g9947 [Stylonectria norvegica]|nr:hypothetical protein G7046_g9947 [Stylonectria norvegica]